MWTVWFETTIWQVPESKFAEARSILEGVDGVTVERDSGGRHARSGLAFLACTRRFAGSGPDVGGNHFDPAGVEAIDVALTKAEIEHRRAGGRAGVTSGSGRE
ncbi:MAG: hypothetical protein ACRDPA_16005 [Solirubrobacteraceae bacterium]